MGTPFDPSEIVGKQAWELAKSVNDYFRGWEAVDLSISDEDYNRIVAQLVETTASHSVSCQTPVQWGAVQEVKEAAPRPAPDRKRALGAGTKRPLHVIREEILR